MLQRVYTRVSKPAARYSDRGSMAEHCSACRFFMSGGDCARVLGRVMPQGWCKYFSREAVQRWNPLWPMEGIPAPPGATLDLSFLTSGALDPRITFTRASTATYFNYAGVMQTAAVNAPRWDYNHATLALNGLLIEEARTNLALQTKDFTNAAWIKTGLAITLPGSGAPDGTSLNLVTEDTSAGNHDIQQVGFAITAAPWTFSVFARAGTGRYISLRGYADGSGNLPWITFDTQTQTIQANSAVVSSGFSAIGGGTYRIWLSHTAVANASGSTVVSGSNVAAAPGIGVGGGWTYTGTSQTWYVWGLQAEAGAFPTSYIPTTAAAVTRSADQCSILPPVVWFVSPGGSWMLEFIDYTPTSTAAYPRVVSEYPGPSNVSPVLIDAVAGPARLGQYDGTLQFTANTMTAGAVTKIATTTSGTTGTACLNGGAVASGPVTGGYAGISTQGVGIMNFTGAAANETVTGYLRRLRYWPRVLSAAEMQQVTT